MKDAFWSLHCRSGHSDSLGLTQGDKADRVHTQRVWSLHSFSLNHQPTVLSFCRIWPGRSQSLPWGWKTASGNTHSMDFAAGGDGGCLARHPGREVERRLGFWFLDLQILREPSCSYRNCEFRLVLTDSPLSQIQAER